MCWVNRYQLEVRGGALAPQAIAKGLAIHSEDNCTRKQVSRVE
ncbi:MAG: hypothetical protein JW384_03088 [Nitrosomonadaceae bacterium]|nr:hypothetical protein [Nitrosomonadaceae bacterium]